MTDWPVKTLGELFDSKPKNSESLKQKDYLSSGKFPVVDQGQELIGGFTNDQHLVRDFQTPVIVFGDHTRCVKYVDFPFASGADGTKILVPKKGVDPRYAYFQLLSIELPTKGYARHFGELSKHSFVLPPLQEQKRIVTLLDAATARVSELTACYEQARTHTNNFFSSALRDALEGNPDWPVKTLGDVCEVIAGQSPEGQFYNQDGKGTPFYQGKKDFTARFIGSPTTWTTEVTKLARPGDILMSVRAPVGPVNLCPIEACIGRGLAAIRPSSKTDTDFIFYFLESIQSEIAGTEGAVFASINKGQIAALSCPVPPLEEQKRVVARLDWMSAKTSEMVAAYDAKLTAAKNLRQSILQAAFAGEL